MNYLGEIRSNTTSAVSTVLWLLPSKLTIPEWTVPVPLDVYFQKQISARTDRYTNWTFFKASLAIETDCSGFVLLKLYVNNVCVYSTYFETCFVRGFKQFASVDVHLGSPITKKDKVSFTLSYDDPINTEKENYYLIVFTESFIKLS